MIFIGAACGIETVVLLYTDADELAGEMRWAGGSHQLPAGSGQPSGRHADLAGEVRARTTSQ